MNPLNIYKHLKIIKLQNQLINSPYYIVTSNTNYLNKITNLNNILIEKIIFNFFLKKFNLKFPSIFLKYPLNYSHYNYNSSLIFYILNIYSYIVYMIVEPTLANISSIALTI
jgi:hypothetical protein